MVGAFNLQIDLYAVLPMGFVGERQDLVLLIAGGAKLYRERAMQ